MQQYRPVSVHAPLCKQNYNYAVISDYECIIYRYNKSTPILLRSHNVNKFIDSLCKQIDNVDLIK